MKNNAYCKYCNNSNFINGVYLCLNYSKCNLFIKDARKLKIANNRVKNK